MNIRYTLLTTTTALVLLSACDKVSPIGVLVAGTAVEDRVKMSNLFYLNHLEDRVFLFSEGDYTFLVGADSHLATDPGRLDEMLAIGLNHNDLFYAHLGDIADTKPEYYITLDSLLSEAKVRYIDKYYTVTPDGKYLHNDTDDPEVRPIAFDDIIFPFLPVVGNHDITHNGWALWSNIFHSSFYEIDVIVLLPGDQYAVDHLIFLDSASGTLGETQIDLIEEGVLDGKNMFNVPYRHTFVFSHTNIFRPQLMEFASTFPREETFFLLRQFEKWNVDVAFCGHVHKWDDRVFDGVTYLTLESMSERNSPNPGDYLVRMNVGADGNLNWEKVHMDYTAK